VAGAPENAEELDPRTYGFAVLVGHDPGDLVQVGKVVSGPGRKEFGQGDRSEGRMLAALPQAF
jgi:hypothetical protein